jgi:lysozyme family protein
MAAFDPAYDKTMSHEGGYSNDPVDAGGETYKGISRKFHSGWVGWKRIDAAKSSPNFPKNLSEDQELQQNVRDFYKSAFWDRMRLDEFSDQNVADEMFDTGVNMDTPRAVRFLQMGLNILNYDRRTGGKLFEDLDEDGKIGSKTISALNKYLTNDKVSILLKIMNVLQGMHYIEYIRKVSSQKRFARGWFDHRVSL